MKKILKVTIVLIVLLAGICINNVHVTDAISNNTSEGTATRVVDIHQNQLKTIDDYKEKYKSEKDGTIAYIWHMITDIALLVVFVGLIIVPILHIVRMIGLYKLSKKENINVAYVSFIPFANRCILTKLSSDNFVFGGFMALFKLVLTGICIFAGLFNFYLVGITGVIMILGIAVAVVYGILNIFYLFKLYKKYSKNYVILLILSIITLGLASPFIIIGLKEKKGEN